MALLDGKDVFPGDVIVLAGANGRVCLVIASKGRARTYHGCVVDLMRVWADGRIHFWSDAGALDVAHLIRGTGA